MTIKKNPDPKIGRAYARFRKAKDAAPAQRGTYRLVDENFDFIYEKAKRESISMNSAINIVGR